MDKKTETFLMTIYRALMMIAKGLKTYIDNSLPEKKNGLDGGKPESQWKK